MFTPLLAQSGNGQLSLFDAFVSSNLAEREAGSNDDLLFQMLLGDAVGVPLCPPPQSPSAQAEVVSGESPLAPSIFAPTEDLLQGAREVIDGTKFDNADGLSAAVAPLLASVSESTVPLLENVVSQTFSAVSPRVPVPDGISRQAHLSLVSPALAVPTPILSSGDVVSDVKAPAGLGNQETLSSSKSDLSEQTSSMRSSRLSVASTPALMTDSQTTKAPPELQSASFPGAGPKGLNSPLAPPTPRGIGSGFENIEVRVAEPVDSKSAPTSRMPGSAPRSQAPVPGAAPSLPPTPQGIGFGPENREVRAAETVDSQSAPTSRMPGSAPRLEVLFPGAVASESSRRSVTTQFVAASDESGRQAAPLPRSPLAWNQMGVPPMPQKHTEPPSGNWPDNFGRIVHRIVTRTNDVAPVVNEARHPVSNPVRGAAQPSVPASAGANWATAERPIVANTIMESSRADAPAFAPVNAEAPAATVIPATMPIGRRERSLASPKPVVSSASRPLFTSSDALPTRPVEMVAEAIAPRETVRDFGELRVETPPRPAAEQARVPLQTSEPLERVTAPIAGGRSELVPVKLGSPAPIEPLFAGVATQTPDSTSFHTAVGSVESTGFEPRSAGVEPKAFDTGSKPAGFDRQSLLDKAMELADELRARVTARPAARQAVIRMSPPSLGPVLVRIEIDASDTVRATMTAQRPEAAELLASHVDELRVALTKSDIQFETSTPNNTGGQTQTQNPGTQGRSLGAGQDANSNGQRDGQNDRSPSDDNTKPESRTPRRTMRRQIDVTV